MGGLVAIGGISIFVAYFVLSMVFSKAGEILGLSEERQAWLESEVLPWAALIVGGALGFAWFSALLP